MNTETNQDKLAVRAHIPGNWHIFRVSGFFDISDYQQAEEFKAQYKANHPECDAVWIDIYYMPQSA